MKTALIALAALSVAGCGAANLTGAGTAAPSATPPSCHAQYETWKHAPAETAFHADLKAVAAAGQADDFPRIRSTLARAGRAARSLPAIPRCADPKGYEGQMVADIGAAADNVKSASGLGGLMLAAVPLKKLPALEKKANAELDQTVGKNR